MNNLRVVVVAQVAQSGTQDVPLRQSDSTLLTYSINFGIETEAFRAVESDVKANLCPSII